MSHDEVAIKRALWGLARLKAIHSAYFSELEDWAQTAILDEQRELMPDALMLLNEIRISKTSLGGELPASWEPVFEEIDEAVAPTVPAAVKPEPVSEAIYEALSPVRAAGELALETPKPQPKRKWKPMKLLDPEEVAVQLEEGKAMHAAENRSTLPAFPEIPTAEQVIAWLEDILARRRFPLEPGVLYRIPFDDLNQHDEFATGPSIIEGDAQVKFKLQEFRQGRTVVVFGPSGSRYDRDMPLVSDPLKQRMIEALRYLPDYTELCAVTAQPLKQPLPTIVYKLLRGEIRRLKDIRFNTVSDEVKQEEKKQRIEDRNAHLTAEQDYRSKLWERLTVNLSIDPQIRESAERLRALSKVATESATDPPWRRRIPAKAILAQATAFREGETPEPAGAMSSLLTAD